TYPAAVPAITPVYRGFVNNETESVLDSKPTCNASVPSGAPAGNWQTRCIGGGDANYTLTYVPGTLSIKKATPTIAAVVDKSSVVQGESVTIKATVSAPSAAAA